MFCAFWRFWVCSWLSCQTVWIRIWQISMSTNRVWCLLDQDRILLRDNSDILSYFGGWWEQDSSRRKIAYIVYIYKHWYRKGWCLKKFLIISFQGIKNYCLSISKKPDQGFICSDAADYWWGCRVCFKAYIHVVYRLPVGFLSINYPWPYICSAQNFNLLWI